MAVTTQDIRRAKPPPAGLLALVASALSVLLIAVLSYRDSVAYFRDKEQLDISQRIVLAATNLLSSLTDAETGERGLLLTGRESDLDSYRQAATEVPQILSDLTTLTTLRPDQAQRVEALKPLIQAKLDELNQTVQLYRTEDINAVLTAVLSDRGKQVMDQIRMACANLETVARGRMARQSAEVGATANRTRIISTTGSALIFALLVFATISIQRGMRRRQELIEVLSDRERALSESQQLIRAVLNNSTAVIYVKELSGRYAPVNRQYERLFHVTQEQMVGKTDYDLFAAEQADAFRAVDQRVAVSGEVVEAEEIVPLEDGPHAYLSIKFPICDASGKPYAVGGVSTDITERKRAEAIRALLAGIVESSDDTIISKTLDGTVMSWNSGAARTFGYTAAEMIGQPASLLFPPEVRAEEEGILSQVCKGESLDHYETVRVRKDGTRIEVSVTVSPLKDAAGKIIGTSIISRDITERKRAERRLRAQLGQLQLLDHITRAIGERQDLHSIFQVVIRSLEDNLPIDFGCICLYDPVAESLTVSCVGARSEALATELAITERAQIGIDQNGLARCVRGQLVYEADIRHVESPFPRRLSGGGLCSVIIAPLLSESRVFGVLVAGHRQPNDFSSGDCEFLRQLSEHVALAAHQAQIHAALQQAYDDLRQSQQTVMYQERLRALGQMASGIAHDINNALSPVALYTESLLEREPNLSPRTREYLEITQRAFDDVSHTVARMQEFYRQREPQLMLLPVEMNRLVPQVLELTRARWSDMPQQRGIVIQMRTELAPDLPTIAGIESEIREALVNLIFNAVDAMPDGGTLTLRTRASQESVPLQHVHVEVADTGFGMDEETRRRCLEPFFTTKGERGTGLGLAMVFGVAQRHNAEIEIESTAGEGTTVCLSFPMAAATLIPAPSSRPYPVSSRLRILLVDDDPLMIKSLRDALEADGHAVVTAHGGQEAIDVFRAAEGDERFALVMTDLGMPRIDGRQVARAVKTARPSTPVILLTGWGQRLVAEGDVPPHVDRVLNKPAKLRELRAALADLAASLGLAHPA